MMFNYYYGSQAEQFSFFRIPRIMITDKSFQVLSMAAKVLYGVLLDRMGLSMKNKWFDEENRVYIIYQIGEITAAFPPLRHTGKPQAIEGHPCPGYGSVL